jgi:WD40 repeat protein
LRLLDRTIRVWNLENKTPERIFSKQSAPVSAIKFSPDGRHCASATKEAFIQVWDIESGTSQKFSDDKDNAGIRYLAYNPEGSLLAAGSDDGWIRIFDIKNGKIIARFSAHSQKIQGLAFNLDGKLLASSSDDSSIKLWRATDWTLVHELTGHRSGVYQISFSPDGRFLLSASDDKTARLWDVSTGREVIDPINHDGPVWTADFSPDGKLLATGGEDSVIRLWTPSLGDHKAALQKYAVLRISDGPVWWITFKQSAEGLLLAVGGQDRLIRVLNITVFSKITANSEGLREEAEQRGGLNVRLNGNEPEILPISQEHFLPAKDTILNASAPRSLPHQSTE